MSPNRKLGLSLMAFTLLMWGSLPLQLKILISKVDPISLTWYRFTGAMIFLTAIGGRSIIQNLRAVSSRRVWILLLICGTALTGNYMLYLEGLDILTPSTAQIVMQTVPFMVLGGGILIFGESFGGKQWWGIALLVVGSILFFNQRFDQIEIGSSFVSGIGFILLSAVAWSIFLLAQKALLGALKSRAIMFCCYLTGSILLAPFASTGLIFSLPPMFLILICSATLIAVVSYLAFSTAMRHVPATTAGLTIANIPLVTLLCMWILGGNVDHLAAENLNTLALFGAFLVVVGSVFGALGSNRAKDLPLPPD